MPAYYLKYRGGAAKVAHFVGFGANYRGTTLGGLDALAKALLTSVPGLGLVLRTAWARARSTSPRRRSWTPRPRRRARRRPGVHEHREQVRRGRHAYTSGILNEPGATDIVLQDFCASDASGHLSQAIDPNVTA